MYVVPHAREPGSGTLATPLELNAELAAVLGQHNGGLDRENIDGEQVINEKVGNSELLKVDIHDYTTAFTLTLDDGGHPGSTYGVPDNSGDPIIVPVSFEEEGQLSVVYGGTISRTSAVPGLNIHLYLIVDGIIIAKLDAAPGLNGHTVVELDGSISLPAGSHVVEVRFGFGNLASYGVSYPIVFESRQLLLDWVCR